MSLVPLEPRKVAASALFRALYAQRCFEGHHHEAASMTKKIIILADGSGNAFTRQESNIWRLYDALDLTQADHLAHYVQGVGTSSFRPWATIDAATGLGVPENVRRACEYLCRNWSPDDQIYMFGFSGGAFTVRTLIGMIHHEGLLPTE